MSQYTKGEWTALIGYNDCFVVCKLKKEGITRIATVHERSPLNPLMYSAEANAYLIAAAPEMYEALKEITELAPRDKLKLPYAFQVIEIADRALGKAEGKKGVKDAKNMVSQENKE